MNLSADGVVQPPHPPLPAQGVNDKYVHFLSSGWMFSSKPYLYSNTAQCVFYSFCVHSLVRHRYTRIILVRYFWLSFSRQLAGTASSFFSWSACNMHNSSVTWVKTKVLWCCTIITTGPVFLLLVQWKIISTLISISIYSTVLKHFWLINWVTKGLWSSMKMLK